MYKCSVCNKEFEKSQQLNGHSHAHYKSLGSSSEQNQLRDFAVEAV
jgi:hypothetical protein